MEKQIVENTLKALQTNNFDVYRAENTQAARNIFFSEIFGKLCPATVSWGDSETMKACHILEELEKNTEIALIHTFGKHMSRAQKYISAVRLCKPIYFLPAPMP